MESVNTVDLLEPGVADVTVDSLRRALGERLLSVVLFGSRARGDAVETSDWDMLVIARDLPDKPLVRRFYLKQLLPSSCRGAVSILARTPSEFRSQLPSLYLDIALDGRVLYDPTGYMTTELAALKQLMTRVGLYRETTAAGDNWLWQDGPIDDWRQGWQR